VLSGEVPPQGSGNRVLSVCGVGWTLRQAQDVNPLRPVRQAQDVVVVSCGMLPFGVDPGIVYINREEQM